VQELSSFLEVSGGSPRRQNSWAVKDCLPSSGKVATWVWGRGDFGQLGRGNTSNLSKPQLLDILSLKDVVLVTGNLYNTAFLLGDFLCPPRFAHKKSRIPGIIPFSPTGKSQQPEVESVSYTALTPPGGDSPELRSQKCTRL
jgi:hypothetical protein